MKISIDISPIIYQTGVSWYIASLVRELVKLSPSDMFVLFGGSFRRKAELDLFIKSLEGGNVAGKTYFLPPNLMSLIWNTIHTLSVDFLVGDVDVFHSCDWTQPPTKAYKVTTIHDLVPLRYPELSHPDIVSVHKKRLGWVKKEVDKIIAVSDFTKQEVVELLDIDPGKIVVIPEAPQEIYKFVNDQQLLEVKKRHLLPDKYLLAVGANPRKNLPNIIEAYRDVKRTEKDLKLLVVGRNWDDTVKSDGVIYLNHFPQNDMPALYSGAQMLVYASLYEGFGLPILEAMSCNCPVVASNITSMPEIAGEGALLVNPHEVSDITVGIKTVLQDREVWIKKGLNQARLFSWKKTAEKTLSLYKQHI